MKIQFSDYGYKRGYIKNAIYEYDLGKLDNGKWGIRKITYKFVKDMQLDKNEAKHGVVVVTEETSEILIKVKNVDEYRLNKARQNKKECNKEKTDGEEIYTVEVPMEDYHIDDKGEDDPAFTQIEVKELRKSLEDAINFLTKKQQQIIRLRYFGDYSTSETAQKTGDSVSSVSHVERRALKKLKEILSERQLIA